MTTNTSWTSLLITGLRGNAKTLKAVGMMHAFVAAGIEVYASNFNELNVPGVKHFEDPTKWYELPKGSVLFVDEAQQFWRTRAGQAAIPHNVQLMETQRHMGIRIVMLTQQPTYLDKHVRTLFDAHIHLVRRAGLPASQTYEWERCKDEPESTANIDLADKGIYAFETQYYGTYRSAEEHYIKKKIPTKLKAMAAGAVLALSMGYWAVSSLRSDPVETPQATADAEDSAAAGAVASEPTRNRRQPMNRDQLIAAMTPRIPGAIWSAPIYDEVNEVAPPPEVACMIGERVGCICKSTHGHDVKVGAGLCRAIVKLGGMANPYKAAPQSVAAVGVQGSAPAAMASLEAVPSPVGIGDPAEPVAPQGQFRDNPPSPTLTSSF